MFIDKEPTMPIVTRLLSIVLLLTISSLSFAALPTKDSQLQPLPSLAPLIKEVKGAVVSISVTASQNINNPLFNDPFFRQFFNIPKNYSPKRHSQSAGSGVIIDAKKGIVITNHHVVANADTIDISSSDGRLFKAKLLGTDPDLDIAVLQIENPKNLTAIKTQNLSKLEVGDFVIAIGNPFGLGQTVTTGIISALERNGLGDKYEGYIQTDAAINPGNSGGALVNLHGELIGINKAIIAPAGGNIGIGFAIPINAALNSVEQILEYGEVRRGHLGVYIQDLTPQLAQAFQLASDQKGVLISQVQPGSAAEKAGLKAEDIITHINDKPTTSAAMLKNRIGNLRIDEKITLELIRNGKTLTKTLRLDQQPSASTANNGQKQNNLANSWLGAIIEPNAGELQVVGFMDNSQAMAHGLRVGDIVLEVNQNPVSNIKQLQKHTKLPLLIKLQRGQAIFYIVIR